ncbi:MAG: DUF3551 domain-containing protein [Xanthobacteraceae bacterium]
MTRHARHRPILAIGVLLAPLAAGAALDALSSTEAVAQYAPWCAAAGGRDGGWDCAYYSFEQCMATARGLGNYCSPNPRLNYPPYPQQRRARRQYR